MISFLQHSFALRDKPQQPVRNCEITHSTWSGPRESQRRRQNTFAHVFQCNVEHVIKYYHRDVSYTTTDIEGMTIIHYLAWSSKSQIELFQILDCPGLYEGDGSGRTIAHLAAARGNQELLQYFLKEKRSCEVDTRDRGGRGLIHYAVSTRRIQTIDLILSCGGRLDVADAKGRTAMHDAAVRDDILTARHLYMLGRVGMLMLLDCNRKSPLHLAADHGSRAVYDFLHERQQEVDFDGEMSESLAFSTTSKTYSVKLFEYYPRLYGKYSRVFGGFFRRQVTKSATAFVICYVVTFYFVHRTQVTHE
ncbi:uncharacterized protein KY384_001597 [Bacidia gigantensis]|uniref:uncharacterized protein n=1 Tax=Bacidia gigantensis TaxID=2732470 RepID=UPI001D05BF24|nr:uncharacterized protein KY384_001597 [Bacidia gigantensis]KAG8533856.1 hypothetical protein KY384_001597 [Bacidia gigantensis]